MWCRVKVEGKLTGLFEVTSGLKQGCPLSTLLFNIVLEWVMQHTPRGSAVNLDDLICDRLAYADDVDICGEDLGDLEETVVNFKEASSGVGLEINQG